MEEASECTESPTEWEEVRLSHSAGELDWAAVGNRQEWRLVAYPRYLSWYTEWETPLTPSTFTGFRAIKDQQETK